MTFDDVWLLLRRHFILIGVATLVGIFIAGVYTLTRTPLYTATSQGIVQVPTGDNLGSNLQSNMLAQQAAKQQLPFFTNRRVAAEVIEELGLDLTPETLARRVKATLPAEGTIITVTAQAEQPAAAREIADAMVTAAGREAERAVKGAPKTVQTGPNGQQVEMENRVLVKMRLSQNASLPTSPSSPRPERILPIGAALGLLVGFGLAFLKHRNDTRLRDSEDVEAAVGASVLGLLPASDELGSDRGQAGPTRDFANREALRKLRTNLRFVDVDNQPRSIVVTSANVSEGKSTVASNLAWVLAESGEQVVLIDADLRRSAVARMFDIDGSVGLSQVLAGSASLADAIQPSELSGLSILAAGAIPPNPSELLGSHRMEALIDELQRDSFVILDAPPLLPVTDAALLTRAADGALVVVKHGSTRSEDAERAGEALTSVGGKVLGAVLNQVSARKIDRVRYGNDVYGQAYGSTPYEGAARG